MRNSRSTAQVYQRAPDGACRSARLTGSTRNADRSRSRAFERAPHDRPRFHDLTKLSRRMTSSLDLRALTEDLVSWAIRETGAATAAITLWDREENVPEGR